MLIHTTQPCRLIVLLHITELKYTQTIPLSLLQSLLQFLQNLRIRLEVPASLAINRGQTLAHKVDVDRSERISVLFRVHKAQVQQRSLLEISVGDQLPTRAELVEAVYCFLMVFALWPDNFDEASENVSYVPQYVDEIMYLNRASCA